MHYILSIAEYHSGSDGELYNSIIHAESEKEILEIFKTFLEQEEQEGHHCCVDVPDTFQKLTRLDFTDSYNDRQYRTNGLII